jgi:hypothetical protein
MRHPQILLLPLLFVACAQGGKETRPQSDVKIAASHHLFGFRSLRGFGAFPISPNTVFPDNSVLNFTDQSTYTITRSSGTSGEDSYAIANNGQLSILVTGSSSEPTVSFPGGYGLVGAGNEDLFFIDRWSTPASPSVGMFYGTRVINGVAELAGAWHLLSLHAIFSTSSVLTPNNVGRGAHGAISIETGTPGSVRNISGTGTESTRIDLVFGGTTQTLVQGSTGDGSLNLTISYQDALLPSNTADARVLKAAAGKDIVFAVDDDRTDGEAGMVFLVRKFDVPTTNADPSRVAGTYLLGAHTLFVNPANAGSDAAVGTLVLTSQGGFRIDMIGSQGVDFSYAGTFVLSQDGGMVFTTSGTNESWFGAIHRDYNTVVLVDDFIETRANNTPELNLFFGVRRKTTP